MQRWAHTDTLTISRNAKWQDTGTCSFISFSLLPSPPSTTCWICTGLHALGAPGSTKHLHSLCMLRVAQPKKDTQLLQKGRAWSCSTNVHAPLIPPCLWRPTEDVALRLFKGKELFCDCCLVTYRRVTVFTDKSVPPALQHSWYPHTKGSFPLGFTTLGLTCTERLI